MTRRLLLVLLLLTIATAALRAQTGWRYHAEVGVYAGSGGRMPFWLRANQFGIVPRTIPAATLRLGAFRNYDPDTARRSRFDWAMGVAGVINQTSTRTEALLLPEGFVAGRYGQLELWAGRRREVLGFVDSTLSSGTYSFSGNALPIPKIQLGFIDYVSLPVLGRFIAVKGHYAHGWFGADYIRGSYLHQKALHLRFGKPHRPIQVHVGLTHFVQWGGRAAYLVGSPLAVDGALPSAFRDYLGGVVLGRIPNDPDRLGTFDGVNRIGNHLGHHDLMVSIERPTVRAQVYYQHPFEDASSVAFQNLPDGLYGLRLQRRTAPVGAFSVQKAVLEVLYTLYQSGAQFYQSGTQYKGTDNYFSHSQYIEGWSYRGRSIGTPFIAPRTEFEGDLVTGSFFPNNRVVVYHGGFEGTAPGRAVWRFKASYSRNYGTYNHSFANMRPSWSLGLGLNVPTKWLRGSVLSGQLALDRGDLLPNSFGAYVSWRKSGWLSRP